MIDPNMQPTSGSPPEYSSQPLPLEGWTDWQTELKDKLQQAKQKQQQRTLSWRRWLLVAIMFALLLTLLSYVILRGQIAPPSAITPQPTGSAETSAMSIIQSYYIGQTSTDGPYYRKSS